MIRDRWWSAFENRPRSIIEVAWLTIPVKRLKESPLALLIAYFDDSGTHKGSADIVVGGFVGFVPAWEQFEDSWGELLNEYKITYLHSRKLGSFSGEFEGWNKDDRRHFVRSMVKTLNLAGIIGIGSSTDPSAFRQVFPRSTKYMKDSALGVCFRITLLKLCKGIGRIPLSVVLESGNKNNDDLSRIFRELKRSHPLGKQILCEIAEADKKDFGALQAADFLAFNIYKNMSAIRSHLPVHENLVQLMTECSATLQVNELDRPVLDGWKVYGEKILTLNSQRKLTRGALALQEELLREQIETVRRSRQGTNP